MRSRARRAPASACCSPTWRRCARPAVPPPRQRWPPHTQRPCIRARTRRCCRRSPRRGGRRGLRQRRARQRPGLRRRPPADKGPSRRRDHPRDAGRRPEAERVGGSVARGGRGRLRGGDPGRHRPARPRCLLSRLGRLGRGRRGRRRRAAAGAGRPRHARRRRAGRIPRADRAHHALVRGAADDQGRLCLGRLGGRQLGAAGGAGVHRGPARVPGLELDDLGRRWRLEELYIKAYPCCRWSQGAIAAAVEATGGRTLAPGDVRRVRVRTFAAADGLAKVVPETTEEAQYSLVWPVACVLARGRFGVAEVLGPFNDLDVRAMFERVEIEVDASLTGQFPHRRLTAVEIELVDGERLAAGPLQAAGEPDDPRLPAVVRSKVSDSSAPVRSEREPGRARRCARARPAAGDPAPRGHGARRWLRLTCRCRG